MSAAAFAGMFKGAADGDPSLFPWQRERGDSTMIAKVRIAPVEQWCATGQEAPAELAGMEAEIETTSMERDNSIAEREWQVVGGPALEAMKRFAPGYARYFFCEHMLEMD